MTDQAEHLRKWTNRDRSLQQAVNHRTRLIGVASGKGGVGKSNIVLNFSLALQEMGQTVALLDADVGFSNLDILLGIHTEYSLQDVFEGRISLRAAFTHTASGLAIVTGSSNDVVDDAESIIHLERFAREMSLLDGEFDRIYIDFGAGFGKHAERLMALCDELILISTPEPTALADAYALLKMTAQTGAVPPVSLIVNRAPSVGEAAATAERFTALARRFLKLETVVLGYVLEDAAVGRAVRCQVPFFIGEPRSLATRCIVQMANNTLHTNSVNSLSPKRGIRAFLERILEWS